MRRCDQEIRRPRIGSDFHTPKQPQSVHFHIRSNPLMTDETQTFDEIDVDPADVAQEELFVDPINDTDVDPDPAVAPARPVADPIVADPPPAVDPREPDHEPLEPEALEVEPEVEPEARGATR